MLIPWPEMLPMLTGCLQTTLTFIGGFLILFYFSGWLQSMLMVIGWFYITRVFTGCFEKISKSLFAEPEGVCWQHFLHKISAWVILNLRSKWPPADGVMKDEDMIDTVTLARQYREEIGPWEAEISYGGEADLDKHYKNCKKNPGHVKFICADDFNVNHLPTRYQDAELVDYIHATSDLTVKLFVKFVRERRQNSGSRRENIVPSYGGLDYLRAGTGFIEHVTKCDGSDGSCCKCKECSDSSTPQTQFAEIYVSSAAHVVTDNQDGRHTICKLFFQSVDPCDPCVTLKGAVKVTSNLETDSCEMSFMTHDHDLIARLCIMVAKHRNLHQKMYLSYSSRLQADSHFRLVRAPSVPDEHHALTVIVSHPHGCSKHISVGYYTKIDLVDDGKIQYSYTTATCPGSSGALVMVVGNRNFHFHSGHCKKNREQNYGGHGRL